MSLFDKYIYVVRRPDTDAFHQNSPAEGPHRYIGEAAIYLMEEHKVPLKICPYELSHYIKVHGTFPHGESELSADEQPYGNIPNVGAQQSFGYWVYIRPKIRRRKNMENHAKRVFYI